MSTILIRSTEIIFTGVLISSVAAYVCSTRHQLKAFIAMTIGYWCAAALVHAGVFYTVNLGHFFVSLVAVAPLVWMPCYLLSFGVSGKLTRRAIVPVALVAVVVALPVAIYSNLTASCRILHTIDTCL
jgi:hypothetical protein